MAVILTLTPVLTGGHDDIPPTIPVPTADDPTLELENPYALPMVFDTRGVACDVREESSATAFTANRFDDDPVHEVIGGGLSRLTLRGQVNMEAYLAERGRVGRAYTREDNPLNQPRYWLRNRNQVRVSSPLAHMQIYRDAWALQRLDMEYEGITLVGSPQVIVWRLILAR